MSFPFPSQTFMSRIRYSATIQQQAVRRVLGSHASAAKVAREVGCSPITIHSWIKKHEESNIIEPTFVPIKVMDRSTPSVEIVLPTGITIHLNNTSSQSLAELVRNLLGVPC
jgi:hypothetical protein